MKYYFCRHGRYSSSTMGLQESEKGRLASVRVRLLGLGFAPEVCWTSEAKRTIQTAEVLFPDVRVVQRDLFERYGNLKFDEARFAAMSLLDKFTLRKETAFVIHSSLPAALALRLAEKQGATIDWGNLPRQVTELDNGCGIFVEGARFEYISPAS